MLNFLSLQYGSDDFSQDASPRYTSPKPALYGEPYFMGELAMSCLYCTIFVYYHCQALSRKQNLPLWTLKSHSFVTWIESPVCLVP